MELNFPHTKLILNAGSFRKRREKLAVLLGGLNYPHSGSCSFLLSDPRDIFYYTGYMPAGSVFLSAGKEWRLYATSVENEAETAGIEVVYYRKLREIAKRLKGRVGYDEGSLLAAHYNILKRNARLAPAGSLIKRPRAVKDRREVDLMREAVKVTAHAFKSRTSGRTEAQVAKSVEMGFMQRDAGVAFPPIVAAGKNGYYIHHTPSVYKIKPQDMCMVDCGASVGGYCADVTRTFHSEGNRKHVGIYNGLLEVSQTVRDCIRPGVKFSALQEIYRKEMSRHRWKVMHYIGHSIGLEVHEPVERLEAGSVITVEPGVYIKGFGGARIEDMVLVKNSGIEVLTKKIRE